MPPWATVDMVGKQRPQDVNVNQVHDYGFGPTAALLGPSSWMTVDPGSKMAPGELRVLQDDCYKIAGSSSGSGIPSDVSWIGA